MDNNGRVGHNYDFYNHITLLLFWPNSDWCNKLCKETVAWDLLAFSFHRSTLYIWGPNAEAETILIFVSYSRSYANFPVIPSAFLDPPTLYSICRGYSKLQHIFMEDKRCRLEFAFWNLRNRIHWQFWISLVAYRYDSKTTMQIQISQFAWSLPP